MNINSSFQNPRPQANEYTSQALHKFVVAVYDLIQSGSVGGNALALPTGQESMDFTYVGGGVADDDLIQTVTYQPSGMVMTVTYVGSTNNIQNVTLS
jgi:hypothetical protein